MQNLWSKRFQQFINERIFILRRLVNGFSFLPLLLLLAGLYYYPMLLEWLPRTFPTTIVISVLTAWLAARGGFRSFLRKADVVYLTTAESRLKSFFLKSFMYNALIQCFFVLAVMVVLSPMFFARIFAIWSNFLIIIVIILILKVWNIAIYWQLLKTEASDYFISRVILNFVFIYGLFIKDMILMLSSLIVYGILAFGIQMNTHTNRIDWLRLIEGDQRLDTRFFHSVGSFVDHSEVIAKIKQRSYIVLLTKMIKKKHENAYRYLFFKSFLRSDLVGIILRIMLLGMLITWLIPDLYIRLAIYLLFFYMIGLQLNGFWNSFNNQYWPNLYPLSKDDKAKAFLKSTYKILLCNAMLLMVPILIHSSSLIYILLNLLCAFVLPYLFVYFYTSRKIRYGK